MADDYFARYQGLSHQQLYDMLNAGDPDQVDALAASWSTLQTTANDLASALSTDLASLSHAWEGPAFQEFQRRLTAISTFATTLGGEFGGVRRGLSLLAGPLRQAKSDAEPPAATDDHDGLIEGAAKGAAAGSVLGPVGTIGGGVIGGFLGHNQDEEEQRRAHQRMIALVAALAVDYDLTSGRQWPTELSLPPTSLPGGTSSSSVGTAVFSSGVSTHSVSGTGAGGHQMVTAGATTTPGHAPPAGGADASTSLQGAGDVVGVDSLGPGGIVSGGAGGGGSGVSSGALVAGAAALTGTGLAASIRGAGPGRGIGTGGSAGASGLLSGGRAPGGFASDAVLGGRSDTDRAAVANTRSNAGRASAAGPGQVGQDDEPDERTTWLTEDDMDWGAGDAAPAVFGEPAHAPGPPTETDGDRPAGTHPDDDPTDATRAVAGAHIAAR